MFTVTETLTAATAATALTEENLFGEGSADATDTTPDDPPTYRPPQAADNANTLSQEYVEYNTRLTKQREEIRRCENRADLCRREHKTAKEELDSANAELCRIIDDFNCEMPLFDNVNQTQPGEPTDASASEDDETWLMTPLTKTTLSNATLKKLADSEIKTMGDLADWTNAGKLLTDIPGIGEKAADKIDVATGKFWEGGKQ
jgi:hypothetical protein